MFYRIITGDKTLTAIIFFIIALIIWMPDFLNPEIYSPVRSNYQTPLVELIIDALKGNAFVMNLTGLFLVLIQGLMLVRLNAKYILIQQRTFLPALLYVVLSGYLPQLHQLNDVLIATLFVIFTIIILMKSYYEGPNSYGFFIAGLLIGAGSLFYVPLLYLIVFIWISTSILRSYYWREYIFPVLGMLIPYVFYTGLLVLRNKSLEDFSDMMIYQLFVGFPKLEMATPKIIFALYTILLILIASIYMLKVYQFKKIYIRNFFMLMFWLFIVSLVLFAIFSGLNTNLTYVISIPVAYILTHYFVTSRKTRSNKLLLYILLLGSIFLAVIEGMERG